jgi:ABC-type sugar transport system permease subunit
MSIVYGEILTDQTIPCIIQRLQAITVEEQPFIRPKGIYFLGKIAGTTFTLITFNAPPIEICFTISEATITFKYVKQSLMPTFTLGIYALGLPLMFGLFLMGLMDKKVHFEGKLILAALLFLPFLSNLIYKYLYTSFILPEDNVFFNKLEELLDVKITKCKYCPPVP